MFCQACGKETDDSARFCPACGRPIQESASSKSAVALQTLAVHVRIMGILWAIYGGFEIMMAFWTIGMSSVYFPLFQKLVAPAANSQLSPESLHTLFVFSGIFSLVTGALGLFAGWMLMRRERSGRAVALFAAFVSLIQLPLGTGLAIYTLVELLSSSAREKYVQLLASRRPGREQGMEL